MTALLQAELAVQMQMCVDCCFGRTAFFLHVITSTVRHQSHPTMHKLRRDNITTLHTVQVEKAANPGQTGRGY